MKHLRNITNAEESEYMRRMKATNLKSALNNKNENWTYSFLGTEWNRQVVKGFRIFDFWNNSLGCAVEVDGLEHDRDYDNYRDEYNFRRSGIVVLRVRNMLYEDIDSVLKVIPKLTTLKQRKDELGIAGNTKESRRKLSNQPYDKKNLMFLDFLMKLGHTPYWLDSNKYIGE